MADHEDKQPDNVAGKFYVDSTCDACQVCITVADDNFKMDDDEDHAYIYKQPENEAELEACKEAMDGCPNESIGEDGE